MPRPKPALVLLQIGLLVLLGPVAGRAEASPRQDRGPLPGGFFGTVTPGDVDAGDLARMRGTVETLRFPVHWPQVEPLSGVYDFSRLDALVGAAADRGIEPLPFVVATPPWLGSDAVRPPIWTARARAAWKRFLRALVSRYGSDGTFWRGRERREPIRRWQIWNEPNFAIFWHPRPAPAQYAKLLRLAAEAIRGRDPRAKIVLAGVAPVGAGFLPWTYLRRLYRVPHVKQDFDLVALHPYAVRVGKMVAQIELARQAMIEAGDERTPVLVSELGVASRGDIPSAFVLGEPGQARFLRRAFEVLLERRRQWRIAGVDWYAWRDSTRPDPHCGFCQGAGLLRLDGSAKPAWWAYRQVARAPGVR
jgi:hypothetical protein